MPIMKNYIFKLLILSAVTSLFCCTGCNTSHRMTANLMLQLPDSKYTIKGKYSIARIKIIRKKPLFPTFSKLPAVQPATDLSYFTSLLYFNQNIREQISVQAPTIFTHSPDAIPLKITIEPISENRYNSASVIFPGLVSLFIFPFFEDGLCIEKIKVERIDTGACATPNRIEVTRSTMGSIFLSPFGLIGYNHVDSDFCTTWKKFVTLQSENEAMDLSAKILAKNILAAIVELETK